jgi:hypothetical protein
MLWQYKTVIGILHIQAPALLHERLNLKLAIAAEIEEFFFKIYHPVYKSFASIQNPTIEFIRLPEICSN